MFQVLSNASHRFPVFLAVALMLFASQADAQKRKRAATQTQGGAHPLQSLVRDTLPNGLRFMYCRVNEVPLVEINVMIDAGERREKPGEYGVARATNRLLFGGTETRSRQQIIADLSTIGASLSSFANAEYSQLYMRSLSKHLPRALDVLADVCMKPAFPARECKTDLERMRRAMAANRPNPGEQATLAFFAGAFGTEHALARQGGAGNADLDSIDEGMLRRFYQNWYSPERTTVVVVGNIDAATARTLVADRFGGWQKSRSAHGTESDRVVEMGKAGLDISVIDDQNATYAQLRLGTRVPGRASPHFAAMLVMNQILGGSEESRLFKKLWNQHTVLPSYYSALGVFGSEAYVVLSGSAPSARVDSALIWMEESVRDMISRPPDEKELARAKKELLRDRDFLFTTNKKVQEQLFDAVLYGISTNELRDFGEALMRVSAADIQAAAREAFEDRRFVAGIVGNSRLFLPALQAKYGTRVRVIASDTAIGE